MYENKIMKPIKIVSEGRHWRFTLLILAIWKAEIRRIVA
jgi:hypothetical protein